MIVAIEVQNEQEKENLIKQGGREIKHWREEKCGNCFHCLHDYETKELKCRGVKAVPDCGWCEWYQREVLWVRAEDMQGKCFIPGQIEKEER